MFTKSLIIATIATVALADGWVKCANENEVCDPCKSGEVRFGNLITEEWTAVKTDMKNSTCDVATYTDPSIGHAKICQCKDITTKSIHGTINMDLGSIDDFSLGGLGLDMPSADRIQEEWEKGFASPEAWKDYRASNAADQAHVNGLRQVRTAKALAYLNDKKNAATASAALVAATTARGTANDNMAAATTAAAEAASLNEKAITAASDAKTAMDKEVQAQAAASALAGNNNQAAGVAATSANGAQDDLVSKANNAVTEANAAMTKAQQAHTDAVAHQGAMKTILDAANTTASAAHTKLTAANSHAAASRKAAEDAHAAFVAHAVSSAVSGNL